MSSRKKRAEHVVILNEAKDGTDICCDVLVKQKVFGVFFCLSWVASLTELSRCVRDKKKKKKEKKKEGEMASARVEFL